MYTYQEVLKMVREDMNQIVEAKYPEDLLNEWAQGCVPIYTAVLQKEWADLDFEHQNRWRECFMIKDLSEDTQIEYLMTVDLTFYYEGLFSRAWAEVEKELEAFPMPVETFDHCASCNYLEPVASTILRDGLDIEEPLCQACAERINTPECAHPAPADFGASQVKDGTLVHDCADCGLVMAWSITSI